MLQLLEAIGEVGRITGNGGEAVYPPPGGARNKYPSDLSMIRVYLKKSIAGSIVFSVWVGHPIG